MVTVDLTGSGTVTASGQTAPCAGPICAFPYVLGTTGNAGPVTLTATPASGWRFTAWSGDCAGMTPTITLQVTLGTRPAGL